MPRDEGYAMTPVELPDVSTFDAKRLGEARRQLRSAVLWPVRVAASYCAAPGAPLVWSVGRSAVHTPVFDKGLQLELRPADLSMQFLDQGKPVPHVLEMDDRSPAHVEAWLLVELLHRGIDRERFSKSLPFDAQHLMSGDHEKFATLDYPDELAALSRWLSSAGTILARLAPSAPVTVGVPDLSLSVPAGGSSAPGGAGKNQRSVMFSLADSSTPEPHFSIVRATVGTVTPLRPETLLPASQIRSEKMSADAIAARLSAAGGFDAG